MESHPSPPPRILTRRNLIRALHSIYHDHQSRIETWETESVRGAMLFYSNFVIHNFFSWSTKGLHTKILRVIFAKKRKRLLFFAWLKDNSVQNSCKLPEFRSRSEERGENWYPRTSGLSQYLHYNAKITNDHRFVVLLRTVRVKKKCMCLNGGDWTYS